jgi:hypothetical protein
MRWNIGVGEIIFIVGCAAFAVALNSNFEQSLPTTPVKAPVPATVDPYHGVNDATPIALTGDLTPLIVRLSKEKADCGDMSMLLTAPPESQFFFTVYLVSDTSRRPIPDSDVTFPLGKQFQFSLDEDGCFKLDSTVEKKEVEPQPRYPGAKGSI